MGSNTLQFFECDHLPQHLKAISEPFKQMAAALIQAVPDNEQRKLALMKLLEAKDCAVRAVLYKL